MKNEITNRYEVRTPWVPGTVGWIIANVTGPYGWITQRDNNMVWWFEQGQDATAFVLKFGQVERYDRD